MKGIYVSNLENIITKLEYTKDKMMTNFKGIDDSFELLSLSYRGADLERVLGKPYGSDLNFSKIIQNYIDILKTVKLSYVKQDEIFKSQVSHISSKI